MIHDSQAAQLDVQTIRLQTGRILSNFYVIDMNEWMRMHRCRAKIRDKTASIAFRLNVELNSTKKEIPVVNSVIPYTVTAQAAAGALQAPDLRWQSKHERCRYVLLSQPAERVRASGAIGRAHGGRRERGHAEPRIRSFS